MKYPILTCFFLCIFWSLLAQNTSLTKLFHKDVKKLETLKDVFEQISVEDYKDELAVFQNIIDSLEASIPYQYNHDSQLFRTTKTISLFKELYSTLDIILPQWKEAQFELAKMDSILMELKIKINTHLIASKKNYRKEKRKQGYHTHQSSYHHTIQSIKKNEQKLVKTFAAFYVSDVFFQWKKRIPFSDFTVLFFDTFEQIEKWEKQKLADANLVLVHQKDSLEERIDSANFQNLMLNRHISLKGSLIKRLEMEEQIKMDSLLAVNALLDARTLNLYNTLEELKLTRYWLDEKELELCEKEDMWSSIDGEVQKLHQEKKLLLQNKSALCDEIQSLNRNVLNLKQENLEYESQLFYGLLFFTLLLLLIIAGLLYQHIQLQKAKNNLHFKNKALKLSYQEMNHRIKNNLQQISSLVYLQSDEVNDQKAKRFFQDLQGRIDTIKLIHQRLYAPNRKKFTLIHIADYVRELVTYIIGDEAEVQLQLQEELYVETDHACYIGLIINELLTNACKHAFCKVDSPKLNIALGLKSEQLQIDVKDNGPGFGKHFSLASISSFGLKSIVEMIVKYKVKNGSIHFLNENGAHIQIAMPFDSHTHRLNT